MRSEWIVAEPLALELTWRDEALAGIRLTWSDGHTASPDLSDEGEAFSSALTRYVQGQEPHWPNVDLDDGGLSDFSRAVLQALRDEVKPGETASYGDLAVLAGRPRAARAVGRVMASNRWPLLIPCHRVVGSDGTLTGFSGEGLEMKRWLLERESA